MAPVIQSYKKVLNFAPTSRAAGSEISQVLATGTDSVAAGQTGVIDSAVPTGSIIKAFIIQYSMANLVNIALFHHITVQHLRSGQTPLASNVVGGSPQRNQVHKQFLKQTGGTQTMNLQFIFKIPKKFQRVRDGDRWMFSYQGSQVYTDALQVIYKFYR